jgi:hypothetical protein
MTALALLGIVVVIPWLVWGAHLGTGGGSNWSTSGATLVNSTTDAAKLKKPHPTATPQSSPSPAQASPSPSPTQATTSTAYRLTWAPPALVNPTTVTLCNCNLSGGKIIVNLAVGRDYILKAPVALHYPVLIKGGHNVVWIGGDVAPSSGPDIGIQIGWGAGTGGGTIHLEGIYLHGYLTDGVEGGEYAGLYKPSGTLADATLQVENVRIESMTGSSTVNHQDCIQHYGGWRDLRVDHFTCHTPFQGFEIPWEDGGSNNQGVLSHWDLRNANLYDMTPWGLSFQTLIHFGDRNGGFNSTTHQQRGNLSNVYLNATQRTCNQETYPNSGTRSSDGTIVHSTINPNGTITWAQTWAVYGFVTPGVPSGGDFVPRGAVGLGYVPSW